MFKVDGIDHVAIAVRDVSLSAAWYQRVLGLERIHEEIWGDFPAMVGAGATAIALFPVHGDEPKPRPDRETLAMRHLAFRVGREGFHEAQRQLKSQDIPFVFQDHQIAQSIYFHDLDGHEIEITTYELTP
jgi:catechol 2,3-dioxygenase-like lactoylglutathione lyase family enzyme